MFSVVVILACIIMYAIAYWGYAKWFDRNVIMSDPKRATPAHTYMDGVEFFPSNKYVLFGFQAKAIVALGPLVGPIIAIQWGWLPALLWILFGNIFIGWLHDYMAIMVSVRSEGTSYGPLTHKLVSPRSRVILLSFLLLYFLLLLAVYGVICARTLGAIPQSPIPVLTTAIISIVSGILTFKYKVSVRYTTIFTIIIMALGIWIGATYPLILPAWITGDPYLTVDFWFFWVLALCFLGSVLPSWLFLLPFLYLTFYPMVFTLLAMVLGAFVGRPTFSMPAFTTFYDPALTPSGPLWPLLFVTIACGAISGMHGVIGSSATSKQVDNEADVTFVGGGAMLLEGLLALTALIAVAILTPTEIAGKPPTTVWITGVSKLIGFTGVPTAIGLTLSAVTLVLTALALVIVVRLTRLVVVELAGKYGRLFKNVYATSFILCIVAYLLGSPRMGAALAYVWPLWGGANQLLAGISLMIGALWLMKQNKPSYFASLPMVFMFVTTIAALIWLSYLLFAKALVSTGLDIAGNFISGIIGILMVILAIVLLYDGAKAFRRLRAEMKK